MTEQKWDLLRCRALDARTQQPGPFGAFTDALKSSMHDHGIRDAFECAEEDATVAQVLEAREYEKVVPAYADLARLMGRIRQIGIDRWDNRIANQPTLKELPKQRDAWLAFIEGDLVRCAYCCQRAPEDVVRALTPQVRRSPPRALEASGWCGRIIQPSRHTHAYWGDQPVYACPEHRGEMSC